MRGEDQKVALVTGGSRGIGKAIVEAFVAAGYAVVINYSRSAAEAQLLMKQLSDRASVSIEQADVSKLSDVKGMVDSVAAKYGRIDVLVNNAGIARDGFLMLMSDQDWQDVISVNLNGVFNCSKAVASHMVSQRSGSIINVSSLSGITGLAGQANYSAAKGGIISFTRALAKELAPFGIRVNAVAPGVIETEMVDAVNEKTKEGYLSAIPLKRFGKPEEVASVVRFLASDDASYITGETICITGGLH
jgi:3-oxoacyl-[acyl-carrier protein] reductase